MSNPNIRPIRNLADVVLFVLQTHLREHPDDRRLWFSRIWKACEQAAPNIPGVSTPAESHRWFAHAVLSGIESLE